nr:reverse transcriptase domain-containing protein [Tanacetum cinerariifolium]
MRAMANTTPLVTTVTKPATNPRDADATPRVNIQEFCEEYYKEILPIIMEKVRRDRRKDVHTRLNFGEGPRERTREDSHHSSARARTTKPKRVKVQDRLRYGDRHVLDRLGHRRQSAFDGLSKTYSSSTTKSRPRTDSKDPPRGRSRPHGLDTSKEDRPKDRERFRSDGESYDDSFSHSYRDGNRSHRMKRVWFDELPPESIDSYKDLKAAFLTYFMQQKKYVKDPVEIHNIKQKDGETIEDFMERFKVETGRMKGAPECMRISRFMHGVNNPELTKRLNEHVPKRMEEMMITTTAFIQGEGVAASKKKETHPERHKISPKGKTQKKEIKHGPDQSKTGKKETTAKDKPTAIYMIQSWQRTTKQKVTQSFERVKEIMFPPLAASSGTEGPLVIEAKMGGHMIHRMYVDGGSSMEILYEHCFNLLQPEIKSQMVPVTTSLTGFSGETIWPLGQLRLLVIIGEANHSTRAWMNFMIVRSFSPYIGIIGRPRIRAIQAVPSTVHGMLKFPVEGGIVTIRSTVLIPTECTSVITSSAVSKEERTRPANFKVALHPDFPDQEVAIGGTLSDKGRTELCSILKKNLDIFTWKPSDMTGVPRSVAEHGSTSEKDTHLSGKRKGVRTLNVLRPYKQSWRMCVDFTDLNKACPQDCYPLSKIDWKVESLCGYPFNCFLDAYKGYHQIQLAEPDEEKTIFHTGQGNIEVYVDDLVVKSYTEAEMIRDIEETFRTLRKVNMKLNPKKCSFGLAEGMFLGYIVIPEGIKPCPDKIAVVLQLPSPRTIKEVQSLNGKLASLDRFLSKSAEKSLPLFQTLEKCIKKRERNITYMPRTSVKGQILADFLIEVPGENPQAAPAAETQQESWMLFMDGSSSSNNKAEYEALIAGLRIAAQMGVKNVQVSVDSMLVANQVLGMYVAKEDNMVKYLEIVKSLVNGFITFSISQVPRSKNKKADALSKIVSTGFAHLSKQVLVEVLKDKSIKEKEVATVIEEDRPTWMTPIVDYLKEGTLPGDKNEARKLRLKARQYELREGILYRSCSMHAGPRSIVAKAIQLGYYWPTMHRDARDMIQKCNDCQIHRPITRSPQQPLTPITALWPFYKWGINIAGPFLEGPGKAKFLIVFMDYFTKWIEAKAVVTIMGRQLKKFVWDNIVCRFDIPGEIVSDNGKQFSDNPFKHWCDKQNITQRFASIKHPQSNGLVKRANQSLGEGIKSRLGEGNKNWVEELPHVLWAHRTMIKSSHGDTPFSLTYGTEAVIPTEIGMPTYRTTTVDVVSNDEELRLNLDLLEERRERAAICEAKAKSKMTKYYNARVRGVTFRPGDFVYRSNDASHAVAGGKLGPKWEGPYEVTQALGDGAYKLRSMDGIILPRTWNIANLKRCYL